MTPTVIKAAITGVVALAVGTVGFLIGTAAGDQADWRTGTARMMGEPASPEVMITDDAGWVYSTNGDVEWIDDDGTVHTGDRMPECLKVVPLTHPDYGETQAIRFATANTDIDGVGESRVVVAVDCRAAT